MSTALSPRANDVRRALPANEGTPLRRFLGALATPGGAVYILARGAASSSSSASNPSFGEPDRLVRSLGRSAPIAILAIGQYFVIVSGEFDLSMGSVIAAQVVMAGNLIGDDDGRDPPVMLLMIAVGVARRRPQRGGHHAAAGAQLHRHARDDAGAVGLRLLPHRRRRDRQPVGQLPRDRPRRHRGRAGPRPAALPAVILLVVVVALASWLMRRPYGMTLIAAGDNPGAAEVSGATVWWVKTRAFILSSLSATLAGIILVGQAGVHPSVGQGYEFIAITAVVLGGVVLGGGRGWVISAAVGAIALDLLFTLLNFRDVPSTWRDTVQGVIIILAVALAGAPGARSLLRRRASRPHRSPAAPAPSPTHCPPGTEHRRKLMRHKTTARRRPCRLGPAARRVRHRRAAPRTRRRSTSGPTRARTSESPEEPREEHRSGSTRPSSTSRTSSATPPSRVTRPSRGCSTSTAR